MKSCEKYAALLDAFADGELTPEELEQVRAHLDRCPACRSYVDDALAIRAAFPQAEETEVPAGFAASVSAAIRAQTPEGKRKKRAAPWARAALPLAACCAIVILLSQVPGSPLQSRNGASQGLTAADTAAPSAPESPMETEAATEEDAAAEEAEASEGESWKSRTNSFSPSSAQSAGGQADAANAGPETGAPTAYSAEAVNGGTGGASAPESPAASPAANNAPAETGLSAGLSAPEGAAEKADTTESGAAQDGGRTVPASEADTETAPAPAGVSPQAEEDAWVQGDNVVFPAVVFLERDAVGDALDGFEGKPYRDAQRREAGVLGTGYALEPEVFQRVLESLDCQTGPLRSQDATTALCCIVVTE